jgi:hypothetical protein
MVSGVEIDLRYLSPEPDRHGNPRLYVRRYGRRIRLRVGRNDPGFLEAYRRALDALAELSGAGTTSLLPHAKKVALRGTGLVGCSLFCIGRI